jgi:hypothetical protein
MKERKKEREKERKREREKDRKRERPISWFQKEQHIVRWLKNFLGG